MAHVKTTRPKLTHTKVGDMNKARKDVIIATFLFIGMVYGVHVVATCYEPNPVAQNQSEDLHCSNKKDLILELLQNISNNHKIFI